MPTFDQLATLLTGGEPHDRIAAIADIVAWAPTADPTSLEAALDLLRTRADFGELAESDREVREALFPAKRSVAIVRATRRGLRTMRPPDFEEILASLDDRGVMWAAIEVVWDAVTIYEGKDALEAGLAFATPIQCALYAAWWTISEVRNGGFHQYFSNHTGIVAPYARDGLRLLGVPAAAELVARAMQPFAAIDIMDHEARLDVLDTIASETFDDIDDAFYEVYPEVYRAAAAYIRANLDELFFPE